MDNHWLIFYHGELTTTIDIVLGIREMTRVHDGGLVEEMV